MILADLFPVKSAHEALVCRPLVIVTNFPEGAVDQECELGNGQGAFPNLMASTLLGLELSEL
jgi:hypothetical protein